MNNSLLQWADNPLPPPPTHRDRVNKSKGRDCRGLMGGQGQYGVLPYLCESVGELLSITVLPIIVDLPLVATLHNTGKMLRDSTGNMREMAPRNCIF